MNTPRKTQPQQHTATSVQVMFLEADNGEPAVLITREGVTQNFGYALRQHHRNIVQQAHAQHRKVTEMSDLVLLATPLTPAAAKETGKATLYRLHRPNCSRLASANGNATPVADASATDLADSKTCTKCKPNTKEVEAIVTEAIAHVAEHPEEQAAPAAKEPKAKKVAAPKEPKPAAPLSLKLIAADGDAETSPDRTVVWEGKDLPEVLPLRATAYPAVENYPLVCANCGQTKLSGSFQFHGPKASNRGRYVECTPCQVGRLAENVARKGRGEDKVPAPTFAALLESLKPAPAPEPEPAAEPVAEDAQEPAETPQDATASV